MFAEGAVAPISHPIFKNELNPVTKEVLVAELSLITKRRSTGDLIYFYSAHQPNQLRGIITPRRVGPGIDADAMIRTFFRCKIARFAYLVSALLKTPTEAGLFLALSAGWKASLGLHEKQERKKTLDHALAAASHVGRVTFGVVTVGSI
ncbi:hypothetical protein EYR41_010859 [Orbilia oligospora]|uniref:Uncharacterized protein n=1 Tax=Orbilia oligospora TaxID=2813651 RepID=A0A7C8P5M1_ORBOL|nr:hypothetical protein TWF751_002045 [Orbilia oligospora]TGJ64826.1 hypothetical protein EYR41_010859 [Orbilia oligospora]